MSNPECPECVKFRKGEFCQVCYKAKKQEIVDLKAQHQRSSELAVEAHKESIRTVLNRIEEMRANTSYVDFTYKLKDFLIQLRKEAGV
jgi:hypothetical protein